MELSELVKKIEKIELVSKKRSLQKFNGGYESTFKGRGIAFEAIRKYEAGDDIRNINWNVTARFRETYVNTFIENKVRQIWVLIDVSGSSAFGTFRRSKYELEIEIAAILAYNGIKKNDAVGVIFFSDKVERIIMPKNGMTAFWHIAKSLVDSEPLFSQTEIDVALQVLMKMNTKGSSIFILSDFNCLQYKNTCNILALFNDVFALRVFDKKEQQLPKLGWLMLKDAETGKKKWVNSSSARFINVYQSHQQKIQDSFEETFAASGIKNMSISTDEDLMEKLSLLIS